MKIDGYVPVDRKVALEQGVTFEYPTEYGKITILSRTLNLRENPEFSMAWKAYNDWSQRRRNLNRKGADEEAERRFLGLIYDHGVLEWSTTIKSEGKAIAATRENFIELMMTPACSQVAVVYFDDAVREDHFRAVSREEDEGNSAPPSAGKSSGRGGGKNG